MAWELQADGQTLFWTGGGPVPRLSNEQQRQIRSQLQAQAHRQSGGRGLTEQRTSRPLSGSMANMSAQYDPNHATTQWFRARGMNQNQQAQFLAQNFDRSGRFIGIGEAPPLDPGSFGWVQGHGSSGPSPQDWVSALASMSGSGGGGGGGGTNLTSTTTTQLPDWAVPYAKNLLGAYSNLALPGGQAAQMPSNVQQQVAPLTGQQTSALSGMAAETPAAQGLANQGAGQLGSTLAGNYLWPGSNPFLNATYQAAANPMIANYMYATAPSQMAAAQRAGQMGGSAFNEASTIDQFGLGTNLANLASNIYGQNYQNERQRMMQAETVLPQTMSSLYQPAETQLGVGAYQQAQNQAVLDAAFSNALRGAEWPYNALSAFSGGLGASVGGTGTSTSTSTIPSAFLPQGLPSPLSYGLGLAGLAGPVLSGLGNVLPWLSSGLSGR